LQTSLVSNNKEYIIDTHSWRNMVETAIRVCCFMIGLQTAWEKVLRRARISKFRSHDLRHHFASRLVQQDVPLNTVRDLLGHGSVGMSLRYANIAPEQRREAGVKINEKPLLSVTMRLQWAGFQS